MVGNHDSLKVANCLQSSLVLRCVVLSLSLSLSVSVSVCRCMCCGVVVVWCAVLLLYVVLSESMSVRTPKDDISVVARSDIDVQIVRYIPLELEWNTFIRYSE